jgi:hypothetical protein
MFRRIPPRRQPVFWAVKPRKVPVTSKGCCGTLVQRNSAPVVVVAPGGLVVVGVLPPPQAAPLSRQLAGWVVPAATNPKVTLAPTATVAL